MPLFLLLGDRLNREQSSSNLLNTQPIVQSPAAGLTPATGQFGAGPPDARRPDHSIAPSRLEVAGAFGDVG
jgi:hypothetical protein